jgi:hypothetical protein
MSDHTNNNLRCLYFHTGVHKTGSTALQVYLSENREILIQSGFGYQFLDGTDRLAGNGQYLYGQLFLENVSDERLDQVLNLYLTDRSAAICSSEDFTRFGLAEWNRVERSCHRIGVTARIITFVRDVAAYYFSLHGQLVKGGDNYTSFDEFCNHDQYSPVLKSLRALIEAFGRDSIRLIHYESSINKMDDAFLGAIGIASLKFDNSSLQNVVNRSLTEYEKEILSKVTASTRSEYSKELSTFLISQRPDLKEAKKFEAHITELLKHRHADDVLWVNHVFFNDLDVLTIESPVSDRASNEVLSTEIQRAIDKDVAEWCILQLHSIQTKVTDYMSDRLRTIDWNNSNNAAIPKDFDPVAYLMLNEDVLKAGTAPYRHYIDFGQYETGRKWRWQ